MCQCFLRVVPSWWDYTGIVKTIPEFKPSTFGIDTSPEKAWWPYDDWQSRIEAFDKLIEIYRK